MRRATHHRSSPTGLPAAHDRLLLLSALIRSLSPRSLSRILSSSSSSSAIPLHFDTIMGSVASRVAALFSRSASAPLRVLLSGLDSAGKTTLLYKLVGSDGVKSSMPTIGLNVESASLRGADLTCFDVGGRTPMRPLFRYYHSQCEALLWMVDATDADRLDECEWAPSKEELHRMLAAEENSGKPLLVFANKQDLPSALSPAEVCTRLGLRALRDREWSIQGCCATTGDGLYEGLDWLHGAVQRSRRGQKPPPVIFSESELEADRRADSDRSQRILQNKYRNPVATNQSVHSNETADALFQSIPTPTPRPAADAATAAVKPAPAA